MPPDVKPANAAHGKVKGTATYGLERGHRIHYAWLANTGWNV